MSEKRYCELCSCTDHSDMVKQGAITNYPCPLLGGKNICDVDCHHDLDAGMGAPDTLRDVMTKSGKTAWEVHETCVACPHGGPKLNRPPKLISIMGKDGKQIKSGPEFEAAKRRDKVVWKAQLERLKNPNYPPPLPWREISRMNDEQRGKDKTPGGST